MRPLRRLHAPFSLIRVALPVALVSACGSSGDDGSPPATFVFSARITPFTDDTPVLVEEQGIDSIALPGGATTLVARRQLLVHFDEDALESEIVDVVAEIESRGGRIVGQLPATRMMQAELPNNSSIAQLVLELEGRSGVLCASPNEVFELALDPDPDVTGQEGGYWIDAIRARDAWDITTGDPSVKLGVVDSGINLAAGHFPAGRVEIANTFSGLTVDESGHGTNVAALVAAPGDDGVASVGLAWQNPLVVADVRLGGGGLLETLVSLSLEDAIVRAIDSGARVVNVSIVPRMPAGSDGPGILRRFRLRLTPVMQYARKHDVLVVWAAGNNSVTGDDVLLPPGTPELDRLEGYWREYAMIVAASDAANAFASFTNRGGVVDITAPGDGVLTGALNGGTTVEFGTSFSAPIVTGVCGLVASVNPQLTASQVKDIVKATATKPTGFATSLGGAGIVNALEAVCAAQGSLAVEVAPLTSIELASGSNQSSPLSILTSAGLLVSQVDLMFLIDRTGSYSDDINTLQASATTLIGDMSALVPDIRFGVSGFADFPIGSFGEPGDSAFQLLQALTCDPLLAESGIDALDMPLLNGNDIPESQYEGIVQAIAGTGRDLNGDGMFNGAGELEPTEAGWRAGALPVLVFSTDAEFHDPATSARYPGAGASAALAELANSGTVVIGLGSGLSGLGLTQMQGLVSASSGQFFSLNSSSTGLAAAVLNGLTTTLGAATLRLDTQGDAEGFAQVSSVAPVTGVGPGQTVGFNLPITGAVQDGFFTQEYRFVVEVRAYDSATLKVFPFRVVVPGVVSF